MSAIIRLNYLELLSKSKVIKFWQFHMIEPRIIIGQSFWGWKFPYHLQNMCLPGRAAGLGCFCLLVGAQCAILPNSVTPRGGTSSVGTKSWLCLTCSLPPLHGDRCSDGWPWTTGGSPKVGAQHVRGDGQFYVRVNPSTLEISPCIRVLQRSTILGSIYIYIYAVLSHFICVRLCVTLWTVAQAPLSMGFSRQKYWSGLPCSPLGDLPDSGIKPVSLTSPTLADRFFNTSTTCKAPLSYICIYISLCCSVAQSWLTLYDPMDCSPPGFSAHEILKVRILEWIITSYSKIFISTYLYVYVIPISIW